MFNASADAVSTSVEELVHSTFLRKRQIRGAVAVALVGKTICAAIPKRPTEFVMTPGVAHWHHRVLHNTENLLPHIDVWEGPQLLQDRRAEHVRQWRRTVVMTQNRCTPLADDATALKHILMIGSSSGTYTRRCPAS